MVFDTIKMAKLKKKKVTLRYGYKINKTKIRCKNFAGFFLFVLFCFVFCIDIEMTKWPIISLSLLLIIYHYH